MTSLNGAVRFARTVDLCGIISRVTPLVAQPELIDTVQHSGLLLGTFGRENNEIEHIDMQEARHVDMVVSDHMARHAARKEELKRRQQLGEADNDVCTLPHE